MKRPHLPRQAPLLPENLRRQTMKVLELRRKMIQSRFCLSLSARKRTKRKNWKRSNCLLSHLQLGKLRRQWIKGRREMTLKRNLVYASLPRRLVLLQLQLQTKASRLKKTAAPAQHLLVPQVNRLLQSYLHCPPRLHLQGHLLSALAGHPPSLLVAHHWLVPQFWARMRARLHIRLQMVIKAR